MPMINTFGVIGGDERMKYLAQSIAAGGFPPWGCGFSHATVTPCVSAV